MPGRREPAFRSPLFRKEPSFCPAGSGLRGVSPRTVNGGRRDLAAASLDSIRKAAGRPGLKDRPSALPELPPRLSVATAA